MHLNLIQSPGALSQLFVFRPHNGSTVLRPEGVISSSPRKNSESHKDRWCLRATVRRDYNRGIRKRLSVKSNLIMASFDSFSGGTARVYRIRMAVGNVMYRNGKHIPGTVKGIGIEKNISREKTICMQ